MRNRGIGSWTARRCRKTPDKLAIVHADRRFTYARLHQRVTALAHVLRARGVRRGDRVAYVGTNQPAFLETFFATGMLGAVFVPLNWRLAAEELRYCLDDSGAYLLIHTSDRASDVPSAMRTLTVEDGYEDALAKATTDPIDETVGLDDPCLIMYTSGTTGRPKGVALTHGNITWNAINVVVDIDLASDEVTLVVAPLFHTAGLNMTCLPTLLKGGTVVLLARFDPGEVLDLIARHRVTYMFGVPSMYDSIADCPQWSKADLTSIRQLNCGGAPVPDRTIRAYQRRGLSFSQGYGMTEASPGVLYLTKEDSDRKSGTAGVPHFFTDVRVMDPTGHEVTTEGKGEVLVAGPNVMSGYWGRPADTGDVFSDGWFHTGDVAEVDESGYLSIVDRIKDVIISGGENIYPAEVEAVLLRHSGVRECAVISVADRYWGEVGRAVVVAEDTGVAADELLAFLADRIARYKVPKSVVFAGQLPRNGTGKLLKHLLRDQYGHD